MPAKVLCVEDNPQNMRLVRKILSAAGYQVIEAVNGNDGITAIREQRPDIVLMDVNLPDIDGLEATGIIRQDAEFEALPILALTANAMHGDRERCLAAGCNGYVPKPITKNELLNTIAHFIKQSVWKPA